MIHELCWIETMARYHVAASVMITTQLRKEVVLEIKEIDEIGEIGEIEKIEENKEKEEIEDME